MNTILFSGDSLNGCIRKSINKDILLLTDVPEMVSIDNVVYCLEDSESLSDSICTKANNGLFVSLEHAFNQIFFSSVFNYKSYLCEKTRQFATVNCLVKFTFICKTSNTQTFLIINRVWSPNFVGEQFRP